MLCHAFLTVFSAALVCIFIIFFLLAVRTLHCFLKLTIIAFSERMHHMKLCHAAIYIVYSPLQKQHNTSSVCTPAIPVSCRHKAKLTVTFYFLIQFTKPAVYNSKDYVILIIILESVRYGF